MKYLKKYFSHKNYLEMSDVEWENSIWAAQLNGYSISKSIFFGKDKMKRLNNFLEKYNLTSSEMKQENINKIRNISIPNQTIMVHIKKMTNIKDYSHVPLITITKLDDEWYYVYNNITEKFYKCDQWDALEDCLEDCLSKYGRFEL